MARGWKFWIQSRKIILRVAKQRRGYCEAVSHMQNAGFLMKRLNIVFIHLNNFFLYIKIDAFRLGEEERS